MFLSQTYGSTCRESPSTRALCIYENSMLLNSRMSLSLECVN